MLATRDAAPGARPVPARRALRRGSGAAALGVLTAVLAVTGTACGSPSTSVKLSVSSGPPGTVVTITGQAGSGCVLGKTWSGFAFEPYGDLKKGPVTNMPTPVATNGSWAATFAIPSYLGGSAARGPGAPATAGRYEFVAPSCGNHGSATAPFRVTSGVPAAAAKDYVGIAATPDGQGYWLVRGDGAVSAFGDAHWYGSLGAGRLGPVGRIVGIARTYDAGGYWLASAAGSVYEFGDARSYGSPGGRKLRAPVTSISPAPDGKGYYVLGANGTVFGFGSAHVIGAPNSYLAPYDAIAARPAGGYVVTSATDGVTYIYPGGVTSGGGAGFSLSAILVGTAVTPSGNGTWQAGMDGGVITGGLDAGFYGSVPGENVTLEAPVTAIAASPDGHGYWLLEANGTVFPFGDAKTFGPALSARK